jgi:hypothetical protein
VLTMRSFSWNMMRGVMERMDGPVGATRGPKVACPGDAFETAAEA